MKIIATAAFALFLIGLQTAVLHFMGGGSFSIGLAFPCIVYLGMHGNNIEGAVGAAAVGYLMDIAAGGPKGRLTFFAVLTFLAVRMLGATVDTKSGPAVVLVTILCALGGGLGALGLQQLVRPNDAGPEAVLFLRIVVESLLTGLVAPVVFGGMKWINAYFEKEETGLLR